MVRRRTSQLQVQRERRYNRMAEIIDHIGLPFLRLNDCIDISRFWRVYGDKTRLTINSDIVVIIERAGRNLKQRIISLELIIGHPSKLAICLVLLREFSSCAQQFNAVPLIDMPPTQCKFALMR